MHAQHALGISKVAGSGSDGHLSEDRAAALVENAPAKVQVPVEEPTQ